MNFFAGKNIILIAGDIIIALLSTYAGVYLRLYLGHFSWPVPYTYAPVFPKAVTFSVFLVFICFFLDIYSAEKTDGRKEALLKILFAGFFASLVLGAFYYFVPGVQLGRGMLLLAVFISVLLLSVWHIGYDIFLKLPIVARKVLILGTGPFAKTMGNILHSNGNGFALSGYVNCVGEPVHVPGSSIIGNGNGILAIALKEKVQKIVVSLSERRGTLPVREILDCKLHGIDIIDGSSFYEQLTGKLLIENMNPSHLIFSDGFRITAVRRCIKRMFDVVLAAVGIVVSLPVIIIAPVLIKLESRGPVLFEQERIGENEKIFMVYKFRTMVDKAEEHTGPVWSQSGDSRITRSGSILRKLRLDEIPQLFNVICGNMSFIGPRPERPFFVELLKKRIPYYSERHCVKPGITGWAQVRYEYGDSIEGAMEKLRYDLYYIKYQSIFLDILIVLDTVKVILFGRGGR